MCTTRREHSFNDNCAFIDCDSEIWSVIAPILLPMLSLLVALVDSPTPVLEWDVIERTEKACVVEMTLATTGETDLSKLSLVPSPSSPLRLVHYSPLSCDEHWIKNNTHHWMWRDHPDVMSLTLHLEWDDLDANPDIPLLDIAWEHIAHGERQRWTLGTIVLPGKAPEGSFPEPEAQRTAKRLRDNVAEVTLSVSQIQEGAFVKITEYIPAHCTCEVIESAGASLRKEENAQIFLWFQAPGVDALTPSYKLKCASNVQNTAFDGEMEVAFGTRTKTSDIASVEWVGVSPALYENMELNLSPDTQSVVVSALTAKDTQLDASPMEGLAFSVQLLANHRDLTAQEVSESLNYQGGYSIFHHEGWYKYLTPQEETYVAAHTLRSHLWESTSATDAFVTASLEGERISIQEALLLSNQNWTP